ncbi:amino acid dehydrogenase [Gammaproteobacteria bacterium MFB021]|nr:amino acid dehydrogenase [Gammaproteobacteria bacterium MFB021]
MDNNAKKQAVVIGGGIVGACCAWSLQRDGHQVTLVDPAQPGDSTAKWSCGQMAVSEIVPLSKPGIIKKIPSWLCDSTGPLALRPSAVASLTPWFLRFIACARPARVEQIAGELASLTRHVYTDYAPLIEASEAKTGRKLFREHGVIEVFDSAADLEAERVHFDVRRRHGFEVEEMNAEAIAEAEPALAGRFRHGLRLGDWKAVSDTEGFIQAMTQSVLDMGGERITAPVRAIDTQGGRAIGVTLEGGQKLAADTVVVAAGNGSRHFFETLGVRIPLMGITGYQALLPRPGVEFNHSIIYANGGFCLAPMTRGLQIGGTIEFAAADAKPNYKRADIILDKARALVPELDDSGFEYGVGRRPFLPDTKPVIDRCRKLPNVLMAFGHGQLGLTLGATTGRLIAELARGAAPSQDLTPFSAYRF